MKKSEDSSFCRHCQHCFFFFFLIKNYYCKRQEPELIDLLSLLLQLRKVQEVSCQSLRPSQAKEFQFQSTRD